MATQEATRAVSNGRKTMNRADLTRRLVAKLEHEEAVVAGIGFTNFDLWGNGRRPQNFYMLGSMGLAFPIALGVAIAQPKRRVIGLEGDGSVLMQLGALSTIAGRRQKNLVLIVGTTAPTRSPAGSPPPPRRWRIWWRWRAAPASKRPFGPRTRRVSSVSSTGRLSEDGPFFIAAKIDHQRPTATTHRDPVQIRENFMRGLGVRKDPHAI